LPGCITITVHFQPFPETVYEIAMIDTRGVDGSAVRTGMVAWLRDKRTVTVLSSKFGDVPEGVLEDVQRLVLENRSALKFKSQGFETA
jgi:hypothetical protein